MSEHVEFEQRLLRHHALVPYGVEREDDVHRLYAVDLGNLLVDILHEHVGHGAVGRREGHADVRHAVGRVVYFVDQSQVVDVDRDFGIVYVLERKDYVLLYLQYVFGCHGCLLFFAFACERERIEPHLFDHRQQAVRARGREVGAQADGVDEIEVGVEDLLRRAPVQHAYQ